MRSQKLLSYLLIALLTLTLTVQSTSPGYALIKMDREGIALALKYGMQNSGLGLYNLLGPNWIEGAEGALLNIYTPFMMLASKSARGGYPTSPAAEDIKSARKRYHRVIRTIRDIRNPVLVKFSVSMYGDSPDFAYRRVAYIEGIGRGKRFKLKPAKSIRQRTAMEIPGTDIKPYEAINAYYFDFKTLQNMDEFKLIIEDPRRIKTKNIDENGKAQKETSRLTFNVLKNKIY